MKLKLTDAGLLRHQAYINGEWIDADDGATLSVKNPANGEEIIAIARVGQAETRRAIEAAEVAMQDWKQRPAKERAQILRRWFDLMMEHQEDLALIMTAEQGKVLAEARGEVAYGASFVEWFGEQAKRVDGDVIPGPGPDRSVPEVHGRHISSAHRSTPITWSPSGEEVTFISGDFRGDGLRTPPAVRSHAAALRLEHPKRSDR